VQKLKVLKKKTLRLCGFAQNTIFLLRFKRFEQMVFISKSALNYKIRKKPLCLSGISKKTKNLASYRLRGIFQT
jgi:hypothetical protein